MIMPNYMKKTFTIAVYLTALCLFSGCASTAVRDTWKSPDYKGGPPQKVAVVADEERMVVRTALENRFVNQLAWAGQPAIGTAAEFADLAEARKNKAATILRLRADGADAILITRLVGQTAYQAKAQQTFSGHYVGVTVTPDSGDWDASIGSYSTYNSSPRSDDRSHMLLDTSLYDLKSGQRLWACVTETTILETDDKLEIADEFVAKVVEAMRKDGMIR
jgi:hypothetical protein